MVSNTFVPYVNNGSRLSFQVFKAIVVGIQIRNERSWVAIMVSYLFLFEKIVNQVSLLI